MNRKWFQNSGIPPAIIQGVCALLAAIIIIGGPVLYLRTGKFMSRDSRTKKFKYTKRKFNYFQPIEVIYNTSPKDANETTTKLRSTNRLRKLRPLETGRTILQTPPETYFFVSSKQLKNAEGNIEDCLSMITVKSFRQQESDLEIHYDSNSKIFLLAYVSDDIGALLSKTGRDNESEIVLSPSYWNDFRNLAIIPMNRIIKSDDREITITKGELRYVLDTIIR